jgi:uncharacterized paraquat-inducible protein A
LVGVVLLAGVVAGVAWLLRRQSSAQEELCHCRCPACEQKIRFLPSKAGKPAQCPRCPARFTLPNGTEEAALDQRRSVTLRRSKQVGVRV